MYPTNPGYCNNGGTFLMAVLEDIVVMFLGTGDQFVMNTR